MSDPRTTRGRVGGLGALFFLGSLGAIAFYVQQQEVPQARDEVRKTATILPEVVEEPASPTLPWQDRLDLNAATLRPFGPTPTPGAAPEAPAGDEGAALTEVVVDPENARLVQDINDGHRILLTLDPVLQDSALTIFRNREVPYAAAVMLDLHDNSVLALAGHSSMDPSVDPLEVATAAWAPAASTFKLITTAALLDSQAATPTSRVCFHGGLHGIEDDALRDDPARDTRCETLSNAVAHSYNLVIAKLAMRHLPQDTLLGMAKTMQFESEIPFDIPVERSPAHIPADPVERAKVAAGFWNIDLSPMHGAIIASIFARGGVYQPPHVIAQVIGPDGSDLSPARSKSQRVLARDVATAVGQMMVGTTRDGTARKSFRDTQGNDYVPGVAVAAKTGSLTGKRSPALNYNWFIGYAPADNPEIAFAVLLANEPKWRIKAHYAGRRLVQIYLQRRAEIARQRDARLQPDALVLPERDPSGALLTSSATKTGDGTKGSAASAKGDGGTPPPGTQSKAAASSKTDSSPLPPVPGELPPPPTGT
ncbi:MAG: penicillin-binding transpeptidase domain-containing protein [Myxococcota bacterium]